MALRLKDRIEANIRQADKVNKDLNIYLQSSDATHLYVYNGGSERDVYINPDIIGALAKSGGTMTGSLGLMGTGPMFGASQSLKLERTTTSNTYKEGYTWTTVNEDDSTKTDTNTMGENNDGLHVYTYYAPSYGFVRTYPDGSTSTYANQGTVALRVNSIEYGTGNFTGYFTEYAIPTDNHGLDVNQYKYFNTSDSSLGSITTPVYVSRRGKLATCDSFISKYDGGTFYGSIYAPNYCVDQDHRYYGCYYIARNACSAGDSWTSGGATYTIKNNLSWKRFAEMSCAVPISATKVDSSGAESTVYWNSYFNFRAYSMNTSTGEFTNYYHEFRTPATFTNATASYTYYLTATSSLSRGSANQPVYLSSGYMYTCNTFVPNTGGTFTGNIAISGAYYPSFELTPTTANSTTSTYPKAVFEGSYADNVSMWIWGDKTNSAISRRGLVLYNYSAQSDPKKALALRQCDTSGNWQSDLYILHSGNYTDYLGSGGSGDYVPLAGGTMTGKLQVNNVIVGYNYGANGNNVASFVWDKPGSNWTGMGACGEDDVIYFGACDAAGAWNTSYRQKWKFNGSLVVGGGDDNCNIVPWTNNYSTIGTESLKWWKIYSTYVYGGTVYGAVWNDYAEFRKTVHSKPGRVVVEKGDGSLCQAWDRLLPGCEVVSDTYGFAIGETDDCKTPIAVSGRVLAYPYEDRDSYKPGDAVCSAPGGCVSRMTRQEITMYPERIIGTVSEIPDYKNWGTGNVEVDGRIWIRIR